MSPRLCKGWRRRGSWSNQSFNGMSNQSRLAWKIWVLSAVIMAFGYVIPSFIVKLIALVMIVVAFVLWSIDADK
jgi:hypothetical protein